MQAVHDIATAIVRREGGFVDDPNDPGGATNHGFTIHTMRRLGLDLTGGGTVDRDDVLRLSQEQAVGIFIQHFFEAPKNAGAFRVRDDRPEWFSSRMVWAALIPEFLWWLMGAIVSFYFGFRYQAKVQAFQRSVAQTVLVGQALQANHPVVRPVRAQTPYPDNAELAEWWAFAHAG